MIQRIKERKDDRFGNDAEGSKTYKHGNRTMWLIITITLMNFTDHILYFIFGKEDA